MKKKIFNLICLLFSLNILHAQNLLVNGGFETFTSGFSGYATTGSGNATGLSGQWQLAFSGNNFPTCSGASCGTTQIDNSTQNTGNHSLQINITKHTNRNDIRLFQSIANGPTANNCVVTIFMRSDGVYPVTVNVFKSTEAINSNGACNAASPCQSFTIDTRWRMYKMYVDLTSWTQAERNNMRISIRPNTTNALPAGPYPKSFWFDDISFMPIDTLTELKDVALQVARSRMYTALDSGFTAEATVLQSEINILRNTTFTWPLIPSKAVGFNPPLTHTTAAANPFIQSLNTWAASYLQQTFNDYPKSRQGVFLFPRNFNGRALADIAYNLYWLITSQHSSYRYHPELFRRFLHIIYATTDDYLLNGTEPSDIPGSTINALNDWFTSAEMCDAWRVADTSFRTYIPPSLLQKMRGSADLMGSQYAAYATAIDSFLYANRDISYAELLVTAGVYRNNNQWINLGKRIVDSVYLSTLMPDGAYLYRKRQNEVTNYHGATNNSLAKIWSLIEYQPAWECVKKSYLFEISSIEHNDVPEFYTASAWKTMFNGSSGASAEPLLAISRNPYLKSKYNLIRQAKGFADEMVLSASYYNANISALPLPDNYVVYDRNIQGPRGRYGRFSYAAVGRDVSRAGENETGLQTIVGAMQTIPSNDIGGTIDEMDASLMAVHSKVHVRKSNPETEWRDWGYMMTNTNVKTCVGRNVAAISTPGILQYQTPGPGAVETNWSSYQQWITLPDRVIGFVETFPTNNTNTQAFEIDGRVRFTYGRQTSSLLNPKFMITEVAGSRYAYGKFKAIIHAHDYTTVSVDTAGVVRDDFRNSMEIIFRFNQSNGNTLFSYPGSTRKYFMVEVRDSNAVGNATVSRVVNGNVRGLIVRLNGKAFSSYRNLGTNAVSVNISNALITGNTHQVLFSRGDSIINRPVMITGNNYTIPANEQVLIISTNTPTQDTGRGWQNYPELLALNGNFPLPVSLNNFSANASNCKVNLNWSTSNETNFSHFELQKSTDRIAFSTITTQAAKCNNSSNCNYNTTTNLYDEKAYYRLKMIDKDGSFSYSKIVNVTNVCGGKNQLQVYPNPVKLNSTKITVKYNNSEVKQNGLLQLIDAQGKELISKTIQLNTGLNVFDFNTKQLSSGNYFIKLKVGQALKTASVTLTP